MLKKLLKNAGLALGLDVRRVFRAKPPDVPFGELYQPLYSPWLSIDFADEYFPILPYTLVSIDRCFVLATLVEQAAQLNGEIWECGVYKGGTAMLLVERLRNANRALRLFDTFEGMPQTSPEKDIHKIGDFSDTSIDAVRSRVCGDFIHFHQGIIPDTFAGLESSRISFAHVDLDIYTAIMASCEFIFPRLCVGGFMLFDDYGFASCPGARAAVDDFFANSNTKPLVVTTGQAIVFKSTA